jgi:hypothetical protein
MIGKNFNQNKANLEETELIMLEISKGILISEA